jgi:RHS repeat-associated protein
MNVIWENKSEVINKSRDLILTRRSETLRRAGVVNASGSVVQKTDYEPFGLPFQEISFGAGVQPYKYGGKEFETMHGLYLYDFLARIYDPLAEKYPHISPYAYCNNNPVNAIDPTGMSTYVIANENGTYRVVGGNLNDKDLNIYSINFKDGKYAGMSSIGKSTSISSFYDSDANDGKGAWALGSTIDPNDNSGKQFLDNFVKNDPEIGDYMNNATEGKTYDFKSTNGTNQVVYTDHKDFYRGMPVGKTKDGVQLYTSARDVGNIAAGYIAGAYGIPWAEARKEFDKLESKQQRHPAVEGFSTQNAQRVGWETGNRDWQQAPGALFYRWIRSIPTIWNRISK